MIGTVGVIALGTMLTGLLAAIAAWTVYHVFHLVPSRRAPDARADSGRVPAKRFLILIPARNEAAVLPQPRYSAGTEDKRSPSAFITFTTVVNSGFPPALRAR